MTKIKELVTKLEKLESECMEISEQGFLESKRYFEKSISEILDMARSLDKDSGPGNDPSPFVLTEEGIEECRYYLCECAAKRKEILDAGKDTADETKLPTFKDITQDINSFEENGEYFNSWGVTDNYDGNVLNLIEGKHYVRKSQSEGKCLFSKKGKPGHEACPMCPAKIPDENVYQAAEDIKWFMFGDECDPAANVVKNDQGFAHGFVFLDWTGNGHSFLMEAEGTKYRVTVTKEE